jgi:hypothetical protein
MLDNFFASVRDHVIAFCIQLPDRVLLPVWEWFNAVWEWLSKSPPATVAVLAFLLALLTAWTQRKHNQLSVTPLLNIAFGNYETNLFVSLVNNGTGPLVLRSIRYIGAANPSEPLIKALPDLPPDDLVTLRYFGSNSSGATGLSIRANGGEIVLLQLRYTGEKEFKNRFDIPRDTIRAALRPFTLSVEYADIYGKKFERRRSLDYFSRVLLLPDQSPRPSETGEAG